MKFDGLECRRWEDTKGFGAFDKQAPGACFSKVPRTFRARKASYQTAFHLFWKANLLTCFKCKKNHEDCEVWWLRTSALRRYVENCGARKVSGVLRNRPLQRSISNFLWVIRHKARTHCNKPFKMTDHFNIYSFLANFQTAWRTFFFLQSNAIQLSFSLD